MPYSPPPHSLHFFHCGVFHRKQARDTTRGRLWGTLGCLQSWSQLICVLPKDLAGEPMTKDVLPVEECWPGAQGRTLLQCLGPHTACPWCTLPMLHLFWNCHQPTALYGLCGKLCPPTLRQDPLRQSRVSLKLVKLPGLWRALPSRAPAESCCAPHSSSSANSRHDVRRRGGGPQASTESGPHLFELLSWVLQCCLTPTLSSILPGLLRPACPSPDSPRASDFTLSGVHESRYLGSLVLKAPPPTQPRHPHPTPRPHPQLCRSGSWPLVLSEQPHCMKSDLWPPAHKDSTLSSPQA